MYQPTSLRVFLDSASILGMLIQGEEPPVAIKSSCLRSPSWWSWRGPQSDERWIGDDRWGGWMGYEWISRVAKGSVVECSWLAARKPMMCTEPGSLCVALYGRCQLTLQRKWSRSFGSWGMCVESPHRNSYLARAVPFTVYFSGSWVGLRMSAK